MIYHAAKITRKFLASPTVMILELNVPSLSSFLPGQWVDFMAPPHEWIGGFSIASPPSNLPKLTLAIKKSKAQASAWVHTDSNVGSDLKVQVGGGCSLQRNERDDDKAIDDDKPVVFCAGGIGISPVLGNYRYLLHRQKKRRSTSEKAANPTMFFYYSASTQDELVFLEELVQLHEEQQEADPESQNRMVFSLTKSESWDYSFLSTSSSQASTREHTDIGIELRHGRYMLEFLEAAPKDAIFYICGPPKMNDEAVAFLEAKDVPKTNVQSCLYVQVMDPIALPSPESVIRPFGYSTSDCGYCKGERATLLPGNVSANDCSKSWGMLADVMTASAYEEFIAKGWRRSGVHLYKPCNFESCCPTFTIRLMADRFAMTKSQGKVLKKMKNLLQPPLQKKRIRKRNQKSVSVEEQLLESCGALSALSECTQQAILQFLAATPHETTGDGGRSSEWSVTFKVRQQSKQERKQKRIQVVSSICAQLAGKMGLKHQDVVNTVVQNLILPKTTDFSGGIVSVVAARAHQPSGQIIITLQILEAPSMSADQMDVSMRDDTDSNEYSDDKLGAWYHEATHKVLLPSQREVTLRTVTAYESALDPEAFRLYARYQHVVHNDPDPFSKDSPKEKDGEEEEEEENVVMSELDWGNSPKYFLDRVESTMNALIQGQDQEVHNTILSNYYSYYQFLVEAPFPFGDGNLPLQAPACGNYHQHYRIGESLVAVGVVDILPTGLSSVYLYYDPAFSHRLVALGKYAILKEI
ncbi:MAG: hypothetical protein SGBAC_010641, partial [Bacillariaceae sp.]